MAAWTKSVLIATGWLCFVWVMVSLTYGGNETGETEAMGVAKSLKVIQNHVVDSLVNERQEQVEAKEDDEDQDEVEELTRSCSQDSALSTIQYEVRDCSEDLSLTPYKDDQVSSDKIFFLETSGRSFFNPRQACAIESAARFSGLDVVVMVRNETLSIKSNNVVCQLYKNLQNIYFFQLDPDLDFADTPIENFVNFKAYKKSKFPSTHLSDALRMALVYKYGGWYADLDYVFLRSLKDVKNAVGGVSSDGNRKWWWLTNSWFSFKEPHHRLAEAYLKAVKENFPGKKRTDIGPNFFTQTFRKTCGIHDKKALANISDEPLCKDVTVFDPDKFAPVRPGMEGKILWHETDPVNEDYWDKLFVNSYAIHFYSFATHKKRVSDPSIHAYAYLAPIKCPLSWFGSPDFHGSYII